MTIIETHHRIYKETRITLFGDDTHSSIVSPCVFEDFLGVGFLVLVLLCSPGVWELRPSILKADPAAGTFRVYFIMDCQASVSFLNTCRHYFIQALVCKPLFWETGQCANSTICLPQCVRDFLTVFVMFSLWICQTRRAASSTASFLQREAAGTPRIHQADFSCLSALVNVGKTVVVTSMLLPSAVNTNQARLIEECVLPEIWCSCKMWCQSVNVLLWMEAFVCVLEVRGLSCVQRSDGRKSFSYLWDQSWRYQGGEHLRPWKAAWKLFSEKGSAFVTPEGFSTSSCEVGIHRLFVSIMCWKAPNSIYNTLNLWSFFPSPSIFLASCSS